MTDSGAHLGARKGVANPDLPETLFEVGDGKVNEDNNLIKIVCALLWLQIHSCCVQLPKG